MNSTPRFTSSNNEQNFLRVALHYSILFEYSFNGNKTSAKCFMSGLVPVMTEENCSKINSLRRKYCCLSKQARWWIAALSLSTQAIVCRWGYFSCPGFSALAPKKKAFESQSNLRISDLPTGELRVSVIAFSEPHNTWVTFFAVYSRTSASSCHLYTTTSFLCPGDNN